MGKRSIEDVEALIIKLKVLLEKEIQGIPDECIITKSEATGKYAVVSDLYNFLGIRE